MDRDDAWEVRSSGFSENVEAALRRQAREEERRNRDRPPSPLYHGMKRIDPAPTA
jgi:hypothetical protein